VKPESNHHIEILAEVDKNGKETGWTAEVVNLAEAVKRKREGKPIVKKNHGEAFEFKFSLAPGEVIEWDADKGRRELLTVRGSTQEGSGSVRIFLVGISDARMKKEITDDKAYLREVPNALRKRNARKMRVTLLGDLVEDNE
jgi:hypothetical protein